MKNARLTFIWICLLFVHATFAAPNIDLIIVGGQVVTMDDDTPRAQAVAVSNGVIAAVGDRSKIEKMASSNTRRLELDGQLVIPGLIESHGHFVSLGQSRMMLDLTDVESWEQIIAKVKEAAKTKKDGEWILGRGWHQEKWTVTPPDAVKDYPTHQRLSQVSPQNPVLLTHASGHMAIVNAVAMRMAKIETSKDPDGGEILRDSDGLATGVLRENAESLVTRLLDDYRSEEDQQVAAIQLAAEECLRNGITTLHDAGSDFETARLVRNMAEAGQIPIRIWMMTNESNDVLRSQLAKHIVRGAGNKHFTLAAIKRSVDGALGAHGAWLREPYDDLVRSTGLNTYPMKELRETAAIAIENGCQLCVHAIGDQANHSTLNLFEESFRENPTKRPRRWRIEHAQHVTPEDIPRFSQLNVIASMQAIHCTSDAVYVMRRLGNRRAQTGAYMWRSLLDAGAMIANGTDVPVESIDPIANFYASVTRKLPNGVAFFPEQSMTRLEALHSYTTAAAYAAFEEVDKGSLTPGKLADITILSHDILSVPEEKIRNVDVDYTIVGGQILFDRNQSK